MIYLPVLIAKDAVGPHTEISTVRLRDGFYEICFFWFERNSNDMKSEWERFDAADDADALEKHDSVVRRYLVGDVPFRFRQVHVRDGDKAQKLYRSETCTSR